MVRSTGNQPSVSVFLGFRHTDTMPLTDAEYEDAYSEALRCLADEGHAVGEPFFNGTGARYCMVDDHKLTDREVLERWWTRDIASEILRGR